MLMNRTMVLMMMIIWARKPARLNGVKVRIAMIMVIVVIVLTLLLMMTIMMIKIIVTFRCKFFQSCWLLGRRRYDDYNDEDIDFNSYHNYDDFDIVLKVFRSCYLNQLFSKF